MVSRVLVCRTFENKSVFDCDLCLDGSRSNSNNYLQFSTSTTSFTNVIYLLIIPFVSFFRIINLQITLFVVMIIIYSEIKKQKKLDRR